MPSELSSDARLLLIKLCCLGDIVMMTPAIRALRRAYPMAQMDFLCSSWVEPLARRIPGVRRVIIWDSPLADESLWKKTASAIRISMTLRSNVYDAALIGHRTPFAGGVAALAGIPRRAGFTSAGNFWLTHGVRFESQAPEVSRYLDLAEALGGQADGPRLELERHLEDKAVSEKIAAAHNFNAQFPIIAILPGGGSNPGTIMPIKRWPKESYLELMSKLNQTEKWQYLLLGDSSDREITQWILKNGESRIVDLAGRTTLPELLAILGRCQLVIGGDSGPLYAAAALNTPTLMLYGPSDPRILAPQGPRQSYAWNQVSCSPCYTPSTVHDKSRFQGKEFICWTGTHACLRKLGVQEVAKKALGLLESKG